MGYYDRAGGLATDGTPTFATRQDAESEREVAALLSQRWSCEFHPFGALADIDWWMSRHGRIVGVGEIKTRSHAVAQYPTVFLNVRKWLALMLAGNGLNVPALFIVRFSDGLRYLPVAEVDASALRVGGCRQRVKSVSDVEPVIEVPVAGMRVV